MSNTVKGAGAPAEPAHRPLTLFNTLITVLKNTAAAPSFQQSFTGRKGVKTLNTDLCDVVKLLTFERRSDLRDRYNLVEPSRLADPSDIEIKLRAYGSLQAWWCLALSPMTITLRPPPTLRCSNSIRNRRKVSALNRPASRRNCSALSRCFRPARQLRHAGQVRRPHGGQRQGLLGPSATNRTFTASILEVSFQALAERTCRYGLRGELGGPALGLPNFCCRERYSSKIFVRCPCASA